MSGVRRLAVAVLLVVLAGCTDSGVDRGDPDARAELRAAVSRTLAADSFHVEIRGQLRIDEPGEDFEPTVQSIDYNAPDRVRTRTVSTGSGSAPRVESIEIGSDVYMRVTFATGTTVVDPDQGKYRKTVAPEAAGSDPAAVVLIPLRTAQNPQHVTRQGNVYALDLGDRDSMRITVSGGYVTRLVWTTEPGPSTDNSEADPATPRRFIQEYVYSRFGTAAVVEPPPADQVVADDRPPAGGGGEVRRAVVLPPPTPGVTTTLQIRGVNGLAESGCTAPGSNPPAAEPARLIADEDTCYDLAPASVEVVTVEQIDVREDADGDPIVDLALREEDAEALDRMADAYFERQVAIVAFGRVVSAPTIHQRDFNGEATVTGLTLQEAADLKAALTA